jgi:hypothetical protein
LKNQDLRDIGGSLLLESHNFPQLVSILYPGYDWLPWKFDNKSIWDDEKIQRKFMDWAGKQLKIKEKSDWYNVVGKVFVFSKKCEFSRIFLVLGVTTFYTNTKTRLFNFFQVFIRNTNGYHGNLNKAPSFIGMM